MPHLLKSLLGPKPKSTELTNEIQVTSRDTLQQAQTYLQKYPVLQSAIAAYRAINRYSPKQYSIWDSNLVAVGNLMDYLQYCPPGAIDWVERISPLTLLYLMSTPAFPLNEIQFVDRWIPPWHGKRVKQLVANDLGAKYSVLDFSDSNSERLARRFTLYTEADFCFPITIAVQQYAIDPNCFIPTDYVAPISDDLLTISADRYDSVDNSPDPDVLSPNKIRQWILTHLKQETLFTGT